MKDLRLIMSMAENPLYLAHHYFVGLKKELGAGNIRGYYHNDMFNQHYNKNVFSKIHHRLFPDYLHKKISNNLEEIATDFEPNMLLLFKGMEVKPQTLEKLKQKNIKLVNYNLDHPFEYFSRGSGNSNVLNALELYDLHISYSRRIIKQLKERIPTVKTAFLPFGFSLQPNVYQKIIDQAEETLAIAFVGFADSNRVKFIKKLVESNLPIHLYGTNWDKFLTPTKNLKIFGGVYNDDYWKTLNKYRIQLNLFRPHNKESHNMRSFEVPAVGGIMLAPRTTEHLEFFEEGKEAFFFDDIQEAIGKAKKILSFSKEEASLIRLNVRERSVESGYAYEDRAKELFNILKSL